MGGLKLIKHERKNKVLNLNAAINYEVYGKNNEFTIVTYPKNGEKYILGVNWIEFLSFLDSEDSIGECEFNLFK